MTRRRVPGSRALSALCGACLPWAALLGCASPDVVASFPAEAGIEDGGAEAQCTRERPPLQIGDTQQTCADGTTRRGFSRAVCVCGRATLSATGTLDAFDSRVAGYAPGDPGGAWGSNGALTVTAALRVGGLTVASEIGIPGSGAVLEVAEDLATGGPLVGLGRVTVAGDAAVDGDIDVAQLSVGGTLTTPPGATVSPLPSGGARREANVSVAAPCDCGAAPDVPALVRASALSNDNAREGFDAEVLREVDAAVTLELPCGDYYVRGVSGAAPVTVVATGHVRLFVDGDVTLTAALRLAPTDDGSLELFVNGDVRTERRLDVGSPEAPPRTRVYLASSSAAVFAGETRIAGWLVAPDLRVDASGGLDVWGSMLVGELNVSGGLDAHYDRAGRDVGGACPP